MSKTHESAVVTYSSDESVDARMQIFGLLNSYPASDAEKERSLGLFLRGSLLARILAIADIYKLIVDVPGAVFDVGTWRGQTAVLCENLRAMSRRFVDAYNALTEKSRFPQGLDQWLGFRHQYVEIEHHSRADGRSAYGFWSRLRLGINGILYFSDRPLQLVAVAGRELRVAGLDAVDGTPVLDLKPYMEEFGPRGAVREPAWARELMRKYW